MLEFRQLLTSYRENIQYEYVGRDPRENAVARETRPKINQRVAEVRQSLLVAGLRPIAFIGPPPAVGGVAGNLDILENIFQLHNYRISLKFVIDMIDRGIGYYEATFRSSIIATASPVFWIKKLLQYISEIPFDMLGIAGFDQNRIRSTRLGQLANLTIQIVLLGAGIVTLLSYVDIPFDKFKIFILSASQKLFEG